MLNWIWCGMMLVSVVAALCTGRLPQLADAMNEGAGEAVRLSFSMLGMMCAWTGLMKVAQAAGVTRWLARLFAPVIRRLFPEYKDDPAIGSRMAMNFSANLLGLGNAATPLGIAAMREMAARRRGDAPSAGMMLFVVVNTASLQIIPTYAVTLRSNYGSAHPYDILPCVWLVSAVSLTVCILAAKIFEAGGRHG